MVARFIHECGPRKGGPFVCVDCSSILASTAESELFGHTKGAFTGAERERPGMLRPADGGTVFLDEVGDLSLEIQPKLLRVLEAGLVTPVGSHEEIAVDVRVIAATNHDLSRRVAEEAFRRDLCERLAQAVLEVPPLRERTEDVPVLIRHFLHEWNTTYGESKRLPTDIMQFLLDYPWPGNVRQLKNVISSQCALSVSDAISPDLLPKEILSHFQEDRRYPDVSVRVPDGGLDLKSVLFTLERDLYLQALEKAGGNRENAAKLLGLKPPAYRKAHRECFGV